MPTSIVRNELLIIPQAVYTSINVQVNVFEFKSVTKNNSHIARHASQTLDGMKVSNELPLLSFSKVNGLAHYYSKAFNESYCKCNLVLCPAIHAPWQRASGGLI